MIFLLACTGATDSSAPTDTQVTVSAATSEPACGPTDGAATEFHIDTDTCEVTSTAPRATLMVNTRDFAVGDDFSMVDGSLSAWWGGEQPQPTAATLQILGIDGEALSFSWSIDDQSGQADALYCPRPDLICG